LLEAEEDVPDGEQAAAVRKSDVGPDEQEWDTIKSAFGPVMAAKDYEV
jgi:hypothetical protein